MAMGYDEAIKYATRTMVRLAGMDALRLNASEAQRLADCLSALTNSKWIVVERQRVNGQAFQVRDTGNDNQPGRPYRDNPHSGGTI